MSDQTQDQAQQDSGSKAWIKADVWLGLPCKVFVVGQRWLRVHGGRLHYDLTQTYHNPHRTEAILRDVVYSVRPELKGGLNVVQYQLDHMRILVTCTHPSFPLEPKDLMTMWPKRLLEPCGVCKCDILAESDNKDTPLFYIRLLPDGCGGHREAIVCSQACMNQSISQDDVAAYNRIMGVDNDNRPGTGRLAGVGTGGGAEPGHLADGAGGVVDGGAAPAPAVEPTAVVHTRTKAPPDCAQFYDEPHECRTGDGCTRPHPAQHDGTA